MSQRAPPPALQPRHGEVARVILFWAHMFPGIAILLAKKDVAEAFRWLWIALQDCCLFAADFHGRDFGLEGLVTALYTALTFGWTGAPGEWMAFA